MDEVVATLLEPSIGLMSADVVCILEDSCGREVEVCVAIGEEVALSDRIGAESAVDEVGGCWLEVGG
jgi:ABC-type Na+ transport system ATPase subunit NatA